MSRGLFMWKVMSLLFAMTFTNFCFAEVENYSFPTISSTYSKYEATVIGTLPQVAAKLPKESPLKVKSMRVFEDRFVPEVFFFDEEMRYSQALQNEAAPLVFIIAGTGAPHDSAKSVELAKAFHHEGFHVVSISSPTFMNFIVSASKTSVPGHAYQDAEDIYHVMTLIWARLQKEISVTDFFVTGYSLGGFNTAFVSELDETKQVFNFKKALLINPPVSLYNSTSLLDRMTANIPGGAVNSNKFMHELLEEVSRVYRDSPSVEMDEEFLFRAFKAVDPSNEELAALVGFSFRISSASMIYAADIMTKFGYIVPKNVTILPSTIQTEYMMTAHEIGFTDYIHTFFYPFHKKNSEDLDKDEYVEMMRLYSLEDYLKTSDKIEVMHNQDDIILEPGEIEFFPRVFGDRAKIYPKGGHCGNMSHRDNVAHMLKVLAGLEIKK